MVCKPFITKIFNYSKSNNHRIIHASKNLNNTIISLFQIFQTQNLVKLRFENTDKIFIFIKL